MTAEPVAEPAPSGRGRRPGAPPRWRVIFDRMDEVEPGQILRYEDLGALLGLDCVDRRQKLLVMGAARKASEELRRRHNKVFRIVRGQGFERAQVGQVIELAHRQQARAAAAVRVGHEAIVTINVGELDSTTAAVVRATGMAFERQAELMRQLDVRQDRLDAAIAAVNATARTAVNRAQKAASQVSATQETVEHLIKRVSDLEQQRAGVPAS